MSVGVVYNLDLGSNETMACRAIRASHDFRPLRSDGDISGFTILVQAPAITLKQGRTGV